MNALDHALDSVNIGPCSCKDNPVVHVQNRYPDRSRCLDCGHEWLQCLKVPHPPSRIKPNEIDVLKVVPEDGWGTTSDIHENSDLSLGYVRESLCALRREGLVTTKDPKPNRDYIYQRTRAGTRVLDAL